MYPPTFYLSTAERPFEPPKLTFLHSHGLLPHKTHHMSSSTKEERGKLKFDSPKRKFDQSSLTLVSSVLHSRAKRVHGKTNELSK